MRSLNIFLIILSVCAFQVAYAQEDTLQHEVKIIEAYKPTISDAYKINIPPKVKDTAKVRSSFDYIIDSRRIDTGFELEPIKPAKMVGEPLAKLYSNYLKLGFGNYTSPFGEFHYNNLRSKKHSYGAYVKHHSSMGKIKMDDDRKVFAGFSDNYVNLYGKKFYKKALLMADIDFQRSSFYYYGYPEFDPAIDYVIPEDKEDMAKQRLASFGLSGRYKTMHSDSSHLNYDIAVKYNYLQDINRVFENDVFVSSSFNKFYKEDLFGVDFDIDYFNKNSKADTLNNSIIKFSPWMKSSGDKWRARFGFSVVTDNDQVETDFHVYPEVDVQYDLVENVLTPYAGITGRTQANNYRRMVYENNFIISGLSVKNTNHKSIIYGGLRGNFTSKVSYNAKVSYSKVEGMYFYVNNSVGFNQFNVVYDNVKQLNLSGELAYTHSKDLNFRLKGDYFKYEMDSMEYAWHKPEYQVTFTTNYNLRNKIIVNMDLFAQGMRYAMAYLSTDPIELKGVVDVNLGLEYRYTKILSAFIRFNNIGSAKYLKWNGYPMQRFNVLGGITYIL